MHSAAMLQDMALTMGVQSGFWQYYYKIFHNFKSEPDCNFPGLVANGAKPGMRYLILLLSRTVILKLQSGSLLPANNLNFGCDTTTTTFENYSPVL